MRGPGRQKRGIICAACIMAVMAAFALVVAWRPEILPHPRTGDEAEAASAQAGTDGGDGGDAQDQGQDEDDGSSWDASDDDELSDEGAPSSEEDDGGAGSQDQEDQGVPATDEPSADDGGDEAGASEIDRGIPDEYSRLFESGEASTTVMDDEEFERISARVDSYVDENADASGEPGIAVGLVDASGRNFFKTVGGCASVHDSFVIGSLSKSFTALCVMQLAEQGRIDLDASVATYVPDYGTPSSVTVRSLLNQTSGFGYYDSLADAAPGPAQGAFSYANANYDLLGKVVERVSGEPYADYLEEHVLRPLGMTDTSAALQARSEALGCRNYFGLDIADGFVHADGDDSWGSASSGYVCSSVEDMTRYLSMYLNLGLAPDDEQSEGMRILSADGIRQMFFSRVPDPGGSTFYGMGWTSYYLEDGELVLSHDGQVENGVTRMCILPERGIALVVMADSSDYFGGNDAFWQLADGIVANALGGSGTPVDAAARIEGHVREDALLAFVLLVAILPLAFLESWRKTLRQLPRWQVLLRLLVVHAGLPALILWEPVGQGCFWRDILTFVPDVALALIVSAGLLIAGGVVKIVLWTRAASGTREGAQASRRAS